MNSAVLKTAIAASVTMVAFAFNSLLARAALGPELIDPASYTTVRLLAGAIVLFALVTIRPGKPETPSSGSWQSALWLFVYAVLLSFAYITLETGVGALILFAAVQGTMIGWGIYSGERPSLLAWIGNVAALAGFIYLVLPGTLNAPDPFGAVLMFFSGVAWGIYSLRGRGAGDPLGTTATNFIYSVPMTLVLSVIFFTQFDVTNNGIILAAISGGITSGMGYALWYTALKGLTATKAAIIQLTAPVIAAIAGVILLSEAVTSQLVVGSILIVGGVATAILAKSKA